MSQSSVNNFHYKITKRSLLANCSLCGRCIRKKNQPGKHEYIVAQTKIPSSPIMLWIELGDKSEFYVLHLTFDTMTAQRPHRYQPFELTKHRHGMMNLLYCYPLLFRCRSFYLNFRSVLTDAAACSKLPGSLSCYRNFLRTELANFCSTENKRITVLTPHAMLSNSVCWGNIAPTNPHAYLKGTARACTTAWDVIECMGNRCKAVFLAPTILNSINSLSKLRIISTKSAFGSS